MCEKRNLHRPKRINLMSFYDFILQIDEFTTLSWSTRLKGFCICFVVGIIFSLMGSLMLFLHLGMARFAVFYTLGNIISMARYDAIQKNINKASLINEYSHVLFHWFTHVICYRSHPNMFINQQKQTSLQYSHSTCFLVGPMKQLKNMFAEKRLIATIIVIISFVCTLIAAIWVILLIFFHLILGGGIC